MIRVATIVEGHGEVYALPILLRRMAHFGAGSVFADPLRPIRVHRDQFLNRPEECRKKLLLAANNCGPEGWILILLDADDDCPADLANAILDKAQQHVTHCKVSVVLAKREFEAWFIAGAQSVDGYRGFNLGDSAVRDPESPRDAKGWIRDRMSGGVYREVLDQPAFASQIDLDEVRQNSRSFRKLCKEWDLNV